MVSRNTDHVVFGEQIETFARVWAVAYDIAQRPNLREAPAVLGVVQDCLKGLQVAMYVRKD